MRESGDGNFRLSKGGRSTPSRGGAESAAATAGATDESPWLCGFRLCLGASRTFGYRTIHDSSRWLRHTADRVPQTIGFGRPAVNDCFPAITLGRRRSVSGTNKAVEVKAFSSTEETSPARGHRSRPSVLSVPQSWPCRRSAATDRGLSRRAAWQPPPQRCRASASQPGRGLVLRAGHATRRRRAGTEGVHFSDDSDRLRTLSECAGHPLRTRSVDGTYTSRSLVPGLGFVPRDGGRPFAAPGDPRTGRVAPPPARFTPHHPGSDVTRPRLPVLTPPEFLPPEFAPPRLPLNRVSRSTRLPLHALPPCCGDAPNCSARRPGQRPGRSADHMAIDHFAISDFALAAGSPSRPYGMSRLLRA